MCHWIKKVSCARELYHRVCSHYDWSWRTFAISADDKGFGTFNKTSSRQMHSPFCRVNDLKTDSTNRNWKGRLVSHGGDKHQWNSPMHNVANSDIQEARTDLPTLCHSINVLWDHYSGISSWIRSRAEPLSYWSESWLHALLLIMLLHLDLKAQNSLPHFRSMPRLTFLSPYRQNRSTVPHSCEQQREWNEMLNIGFIVNLLVEYLWRLWYMHLDTMTSDK